MASTKYQKKPKIDNEIIKQKEAENEPQEKNPIYTQLHPAAVKSVLENEAHDTITPSEDPRDEGSEFLDKIVISDGRNSFEMRLTKRPNRLTKISLFLNQEEVRAATYAGKSAGQNYFKLLKLSLGK